MTKQLHTSAKNVSERMVTDVPIVKKNHTLADVRKHIEHRAADFSTINYIYVVDEEHKLSGVLSIRQLFQHSPSSVAKDVCLSTGLVTVHPHDHQERAALLALKHNIKALPVVDKDGIFLGEVSSDAILTILYTEMHEDALLHAGIRHAGGSLSIFRYSVFASIKHRLPWLLLGLVGGLFAANIIGFFEETLSKHLILAAFIPLIVYISDAVRTQMEAYIIRDLAMEHSLPFLRYFLRHLIVVISIGGILAILLFGTFGLFYHDWHIASVLSLSLFIAVFSTVLTGLFIPYFFSFFGQDPADASGPIATIIQDILSISMYLGIATALLS
jgi:magnesium transporter